jgi:hypothetical protein
LKSFQISGRLYVWTKKDILLFNVIWRKNAQEGDVNIDRKSGRMCKEAAMVSIEVLAQYELHETGKGKR